MKYLLVAVLLIGGSVYADTYSDKAEREQKEQQQRYRDTQRQMEDRYRQEQQQNFERKYKAEQERHRLEYDD
jgi:hypothetical protein